MEAVGLGIVIRDSFGRVIGSLAERVPLPSSAAMVEALACRRALLFAKELCIFEAVVEGDAELIIRALPGREVHHPEYGHVIQDNLALAAEFHFCNFEHVRRIGNSVPIVLLDNLSLVMSYRSRLSPFLLILSPLYRGMLCNSFS